MGQDSILKSKFCIQSCWIPCDLSLSSQYPFAEQRMSIQVLIWSQYMELKTSKEYVHSLEIKTLELAGFCQISTLLHWDIS
jgi:hypothetical protein